MEADSVLHLATVDLEEAKKNPLAAGQEIITALKEVGFLYLINVSQLDFENLLESTKWLFNLPPENKRHLTMHSLERRNKNIYRGYFPIIPGVISYKEVYEMGGFFDKKSSEIRLNPEGRPYMKDIATEANVWPTSDEPSHDERFKKVMIEAYEFYRSTGEFIMELIAEGLGLSKDYFKSFFEPETMSTLRLLHYPSRLQDPDIPERARDGNLVLTTPAHSDATMLTLLATFDNEGLQVLHKNKWFNIPNRKNSLVMNIGALLSQMLGPEFKATIHRIIDIGKDRYSVPFFYEGHFDADVSCDIYGKGIEGTKSRPHRYGPWVFDNIKRRKVVEYQLTDFGIID